MDNLTFCLDKFRRLYPEAAPLVEKAVPVDLALMPIESFKIKEDIFNVQDLFIYGVGRGEYYQLLKKWLHERFGRVLVFIEQDLGVLRALFETDVGKEMLMDDRVEVLLFNPNDPAITLHRLMWHGVTHETVVLGDPRIIPESLDKLQHMLKFDQERINWVSRDFQYFGLGQYVNAYANLKALPECYDGNSLYGKAKNIPAIILGAGPSLDKNGALLNGLKDKAILLAGGSSLPAIKQFGLEPHLGGGIDPNLWQLERLRSYGPIHFPFLFAARFNTTSLPLLQGKKVYIPGSGSFAGEHWINQKLGIPETPFAQGHNVIHFLVEMARLMGCNPIIFVGMDLSYQNNIHYATGVTQPDSPAEDCIEWPDINGQPITTRWMWIKESLWLSQYAEQYPDITFINATEGGIGFKGMPNKPLQEVADSLKTTYDFNKILKFKKFRKTDKQILKVMQTLYTSLQKLDKIVSDLDLFYAGIDLNHFDEKDVAFPEAPGLMEKLKSEVAFDAVLVDFYNYCMELIANSHITYLITRDGMNIKFGRYALSFHHQKNRFLKEVISGQLQVIRSLYAVE